MDPTDPESTGLFPSATQPPNQTRTSPTSEASPAPALHVPGYELLGELGRGGMGVVYKARQTDLGRVVALKMILGGSHAGPDDLARFRGDAAAAARLAHPNIVQIHEVGEAGGQPYFSLEFCPGGSLEKRLAGAPLSPPDAARLVETLARAMQAAHDKGIVHRDLKPANVLLGEDGTPKVSDFGLARKLDEVGQTRSGAVMGTPSYMAPEQAEGRNKDIGPAVDIYALGAILYECLTGRPPFKTTADLDTLLQVLSAEPVAPSRLAPGVPRDLETITLKCLHKDLRKRYPTAGALADDLRAFLEGRPIVARPAGPAERAWRWCKRNPAVAAAAASAALFLTVGAAVSAVLAIRATSHAARAEAREREVRDEQARTSAALAAEARRRLQARQALDVLTDSVIDDLLARQQQLAPGQKAFLEKVLKLQQEFADDIGDDQASLLAAADGQRKVAALQHRLGRLPEAELAYRKVLKLYERLDDTRSRQSAGWNNLGNVLREAGRDAEAAQAFRRSVELSDKEPALSGPVPLGLLRARMNEALRRELAHDLVGAEAGYREVLARLAPLEAGPTVPDDVLTLLAMCRSNLGSALSSARKFPEAAEQLQKAVPALRLLHQGDPTADRASSLAKAIHNLGSALEGTGDGEGAAKMFREAAEVEEKLVEQYPGVPEYRVDLAKHLDRLATVLRRSGKRDEAEPLYRRAVAEAARATRDRPRALEWRQVELSTGENLATLLAESGRFAEAEKAQRDVLARHQALTKDFPALPQLALLAVASRNNFVRMLQDQDRHEDAAREAAETIRLADELAGRGVAGTGPVLAQALMLRASARVALRQFAAAQEDCERGLKLGDAESGPWLTFFRACCLARQDRAEEAAGILDGMGPPPAMLATEAARVYALAAAAAKDDKRREQRASSAVSLLRQALQTGPFREAARRRRFLADPELDGVRARKDFRALLED